MSHSTNVHPGGIVVLDYGSQFTQLIARRVRELGVYAELLPWDVDPARLTAIAPAGIILSGGPNSVYDSGAPTLSKAAADYPTLGICYGMQLIAHTHGGQVANAPAHEYGAATVTLHSSPLFAGLPDRIDVWMSHGDRIAVLPPGTHAIAASDSSPLAALADDSRKLYAVQFHPEVSHTPLGSQILRNFVLDICGCVPDWTATAIVDEAVARVKDQVGEGRVLLALSGGVDSAVAAALIQRAIGDRLTCVFVNNGLLRRGEPDQVVDTFHARLGDQLIAVDATEVFLSELDGVTDPDRKRQIIGAEFIKVFEAEALKLKARGSIDFLGQGTIYPDVIESAAAERPGAHQIKRHHNVGGLPDTLSFKLIEPLRYLFKDEVRRVGTALGLPDAIVWRQPFPGPGLAIRCPGAVTWERLERLRSADAILLDELGRAGLLRGDTAQAFAVLLPVRSVGVMGDARTYEETIAIRAVTTDDFMTADWARLPYEVLARISNRIVAEVRGINRVLYDISTKPPATIEWE